MESGKDNTLDRCWSEIGIWGKGREKCALLKEVIHCNNCDVFRRHSQLVYEKNIIPEYTDEWTRQIAARKEESRKTTRSVLVFRLGSEWLSLPTVTIKEIVHVRPVHKLPHNRNRMLSGIANISGGMELCFSLEKILGIEEEPRADGERMDTMPAEKHRMIFAVYNKNKYIFVADEVGEIIRFSDSDEQELPSTVNQETGSFMKGIIDWRDQRVGNIDPELLFSLIDRSLQ